jgi:hypothetical protein
LARKQSVFIAFLHILFHYPKKGHNNQIFHGLMRTGAAMEPGVKTSLTKSKEGKGSKFSFVIPVDLRPGNEKEG